MGPLDPEREVRQPSWHFWQPEGNESKSDVIDCPRGFGSSGQVGICLVPLNS